MRQRLSSLEDVLRYIVAGLGPIAIEIQDELSKYIFSDELLARAGCLPHYTSPFGHLMQFGEDLDLIQNKLLEHYERNWQAVRSDIESHISNYRIDIEARATLGEALDAHEAGLYRCVSRVLFPEIERLFRSEALTDRIGRIRYKCMIKGLVRGESDLTQDASLGEFTPNGLYELAIFKRLTRVLDTGLRVDDAVPVYGFYENVFTEEELQRVLRDPVPNRHAAMHGLVVYSSPINSLNMIFFTDYMYQIVNCLKKRKSHGQS